MHAEYQLRDADESHEECAGHNHRDAPPCVPGDHDKRDAQRRRVGGVSARKAVLRHLACVRSDSGTVPGNELLEQWVRNPDNDDGDNESGGFNPSPAPREDGDDAGCRHRHRFEVGDVCHGAHRCVKPSSDNLMDLGQRLFVARQVTLDGHPTADKDEADEEHPGGPERMITGRSRHLPIVLPIQHARWFVEQVQLLAGAPRAHLPHRARSTNQATAALPVIVPMSLGAVSLAPIYSCPWAAVGRQSRA